MVKRLLVTLFMGKGRQIHPPSPPVKSIFKDKYCKVLILSRFAGESKTDCLQGRSVPVLLFKGIRGVKNATNVCQGEK